MYFINLDLLQKKIYIYIYHRFALELMDRIIVIIAATIITKIRLLDLD